MPRTISLFKYPPSRRVFIFPSGIFILISPITKYPSSSLPEKKFMEGEPINPPTKTLLGLSYTSFGAPKEVRSEEHTSELQSRGHLVCRLLLEKKKATAAQEERYERRPPPYRTASPT